MILSLVGAALLVAGTYAAYVLARPRPAAPPEAWHPDPAATVGRRRWWDGRAWTGRLEDGGPPADRGRRFRGRFWGPWAWYLLAAVVVVVVMSAGYGATENVQLLGVTSGLGMALVCWAFYRFVARQLDLDSAVTPLQVVVVAVAAGGAVLLIAANVNSLVIDEAGIGTATNLVGFVEEGTKYLVPIVLFLLGAYRDPRAGIGIGLGAGFGFAVVETTQYAYQFASGSTPAFCGGETTQLDATQIVQAQVFRIFTVSPLHWFWTGIAVAIGWRLWHLYGRRGTPGALGGLLLVMVVHSLNDSSSTAFCDDEAVSSLMALLRYVLLVAMYLTLRAWSRKSTPPQLIGAVSRGWTPRHLPTRVRPDEARGPAAGRAGAGDAP